MQEIYKKLGLNSEPKPGDMLPKPIMNYTTKLESGDRNLTDEEAYKISGLIKYECVLKNQIFFKAGNLCTN